MASNAITLNAYVVLTGKGRDTEVDQICGSQSEARREVKDLKAMGIDDARFKAFASWADAEAYADKLRGY